MRAELRDSVRGTPPGEDDGSQGIEKDENLRVVLQLLVRFHGRRSGQCPELPCCVPEEVALSQQAMTTVDVELVKARILTKLSSEAHVSNRNGVCLEGQICRIILGLLTSIKLSNFPYRLLLFVFSDLLGCPAA